MNGSIRTRILGPVALLIAMGLLANVWISFAALHSHRSTRAYNDRAFATLQLAKDARRAFAAADGFVANIVDFNVLRRPEYVRARFVAALKELNAEITALEGAVSEEETDATFGALREAIARWSAESSVAVGLAPSSAVPTRHFLTKLSADVTAGISRIEAIAQDKATELAADERTKFARQMFYAFTINFAAFSMVAIVALRQAGWLAGALKTLLDTMQSVSGGRFEAAVPHRDRPDEIGAMARGVATFADGLRELTRAKEKIEHMAHNDDLTGLANRRMLNEYLRALMDPARGAAPSFALLHVDLDRFKQVNDVLGHGAGDSILCEAARAMLKNVRDGDLVARIGGDEFVIVVDVTSPQIDITDLAQRVIDEISRPIAVGNDFTQVGASIGVAFAADAHGNPERLLANSDIALYEAKAIGRGRYCIYSRRRARSWNTRTCCCRS